MPRRRACRDYLWAKARELFPDDPNATPLDVVVDHVASGGTLVSLAEKIEGATGLTQSRETVRLVAHEFDNAHGRLEQARKLGAHALAEGSVQIADTESMVTATDVQRAKLRIDARQFIAERWNREEFGNAKSVGVQINIGSLHLGALRAREVPNALALPAGNVSEIAAATD